MPLLQHQGVDIYALQLGSRIPVCNKRPLVWTAWDNHVTQEVTPAPGRTNTRDITMAAVLPIHRRFQQYANLKLLTSIPFEVKVINCESSF